MRKAIIDHIGSYHKQYLSQSILLNSLRLHQVFELECNDKEFFLADATTGTVLMYCVSGAGNLCGDKGETLPLKTGTIIVCPALQYSQIQCSDSENPIHCVGLVFSPINSVSSSAQASLNMFYDSVQIPFTASCRSEINDLFSFLIGELMMSQTSMMVLNGIIEQILVLAYRAFSTNAPAKAEESHSVNVVGHTAYAIIRYVDDHLCTMNNLMDMAKELGYSYNYLSHLFRRKTGMTIQAYVSQKKIEKSIELLSDERLSITEIASTLNYDCIQSFSKAFRRAMNMSPTEYRAMHGLAFNE